VTEVAQDLARAEVMLGLKRYDEAASVLAHAVAAEPTNSWAWCLLATAHLQADRYQEAADAARRAITLTPSNDWPYRVASIAQVHLGNITAARALAREACKLAPNQWQSYFCLAQAEVAGQADFAAAERAAATALRLAPNEADVHFIAGRVSFARGNRKAARAHMERALALDPAHAGVLNDLGRHAADPARAARYFVHAAQSAPGVSMFGENVGVIVRRLVALTIYAACIASLVIGELANGARLGRGPVLITYALIVVLTLGLGAVQLRRMPPQTRPLFRTRRVVLALATVYGTILIAVIVAAVTPARALTSALPAVTVVIVLSRFAAYAILRGKVHSTVSRSSLDALTKSREHDTP
jgi:tetratricopeptide (TPR) repeat protein